MTKKLTPQQKKEQAYHSILKTLLAIGKTSKLGLHGKLSPEEKMSRATLGKRVDELADKDMMDIEKGSRGPVGTDNCMPTVKGLTYLLIEANLSDAELEKALRAYFNSEVRQFRSVRPFIKNLEFESIFLEGLRDSIFGMRPRMNFRYYDDKYTRRLFLDVFRDTLLGLLLTKQPQKLRTLASQIISTRRSKKLVLGWLKDELRNAKENKMAFNGIIKMCKLAIQRVQRS